ncbi:MAG TPA: universal stress protein [Gemmatimonadales bacterium]|nr:universal stress protein [Gemmatimonadales bacterium]
MLRQPIVIGVDGSRQSALAGSAGWMLARSADVPCCLVHAANDVSSGMEFAGTGVATEALQLAALRRARADVSASLRGFVPPTIVDGMVVSIGPTAQVLESVMREIDAALLVLGGKHHSRLGRWLGGSTVQQVVRSVSVPMLVTAGDLRPHPRVLLAVDASYAAAPTARKAVAFARTLGSPLRALHVVDPPPAIAELPPDWSRKIVERDIWPMVPLIDEGKVVHEGEPFETIVNEAVAWGADVIVVGSHGKGWVDRLLIGSVTEDLLNNLPCAVLVVPVAKPETWEPAAVYAEAVE